MQWDFDAIFLKYKETKNQDAKNQRINAKEIQRRKNQINSKLKTPKGL